jgi:hypothetical protein
LEALGRHLPQDGRNAASGGHSERQQHGLPDPLRRHSDSVELATYKVIGQAGFVFNYTHVHVGTYAAETPQHVLSKMTVDTTDDGDWAPGLLKGECASGRRVLGVSRILTGNNSIRNLFCEPASTLQDPGNLTLNITNGKRPGSSTGGDWDPGFIKGQCPDGSTVTGVARRAGRRQQGAVRSAGGRERYRFVRDEDVRQRGLT